MAPITCASCGNHTSTLTPSCPYCRRNALPRPTRWLHIVATILSAIPLLLIAAC